MKRSALLCCAALGAISVAPAAAAAEPVTLVVDDDGGQCGPEAYRTIGAAVTAAKNGDTVKVCPGSYAERVTITKKITIQGPVEAVKGLDCFLPDEAQFTGLLDPARFAILSPPGAPEEVADSILSLQANSIELSGLVVQEQNNSQATVVDNPARPFPLSPSTLALHEAAIETDNLHSGFNIHDNLIRNNYLGVELGSTGIYTTELGTTDGRASVFANNCLRNNYFGVANQRYVMRDVSITGNKSYGQDDKVYEIGWSYAGAESVTIRDNDSRRDRFFVGVENTNNVTIGGVKQPDGTFIGGNRVNQDPGLDPAVRFPEQVPGQPVITSRGVEVYGRNQGLSILGNSISHLTGANVAFLAPRTVAPADTASGVLVEGNALTMTTAGLSMTPAARARETRILGNDLSWNDVGLFMAANNNANIVTGNIANNNKGTDLNEGDGISVRGSNNTFESNTMLDNGRLDARDEGTLNTWTKNICVNANPPGICPVAAE
ncbi:hypothetical protein ACIQCN_00815 [Pseudarthrobacter sp. NPDC092424]|uniref:hypothetical protein n=1 Tax=Pseudarthrobacter sp. NPDC092424 TaxID=3364415 RepID=UPI0038235ACC